MVLILGIRGQYGIGNSHFHDIEAINWLFFFENALHERRMGLIFGVLKTILMMKVYLDCKFKAFTRNVYWVSNCELELSFFELSLSKSLTR